MEETEARNQGGSGTRFEALSSRLSEELSGNRSSSGCEWRAIIRA